MANRNGRAIRFNESNVRNMGRGATGVKAMKLDDDDEDQIVGMIALSKPSGWGDEEATDNEDAAENEQAEDTEDTADINTPTASEEGADEEETYTAEDISDDELLTLPTVLVLSEKGVGKRSTINEYRITRRNGKGVKTINITEKTGKLVAIKKVTEDDDIMIINKSGVTIRLAVRDIKKSARNTQGVKLIDIQKRNDVISSVCVVEHSDQPEETDPDNNAEQTIPEQTANEQSATEQPANE